MNVINIKNNVIQCVISSDPDGFFLKHDVIHVRCMNGVGLSGAKQNRDLI
jgi:hypothetical protein